MEDQKVNFSTMSTKTAIRYCKENQSEFKRHHFFKGEDGELRYKELIQGLENGFIKARDLSSYGVQPSYY